ncbi:MAG: PAS domain S-box protein [Pseudomonadota bacterium]
MLEKIKKYLSFPRRLVVKLIFSIIVVSSVLTLIGTCFELYLEYRQDLEDVDGVINHIENIHKPTIIKSLWINDKSLLDDELNGLLGYQQIHHVVIELQNEIITEKEEIAQPKRSTTYTFPLIRNYNNDLILLGKLRVVINLDKIYQRLYDRAFIIFITQGVKAFFVTFMMFFLFEFLVGRHLYAMAKYSENFDEKKSLLPFALDRAPVKHNKLDELDVLAGSINQLRNKSLHDIHLKQAEEKKRKSVEALSEMFASTEKIEEIYKKFPEIVGGIFDFPLVFLVFYERLSGERKIGGIWDEKGRLHQFKNEEIEVEFLDPEIGNSRDFYAITDVAENKRFVSSPLREIKVEMVCEMPLVVEGNLLGSLLLCDFQQRPLTEEFVSLLYVVANRFSPGVMRMKAEEKLRDTEERLRQILDTMNEFVVYHDNDMRILWVNRAAAEFVNMDIDEMIGKHCYQIWANYEEPCPDCPIISAKMQGKKISEEKQTLGRIVHIDAFPLINKDGVVTGSLQVGLDITDQKKAEAALETSETRFRNLVEESSEWIWETDDKGNFTYCSPRVYDILGYTPNEMLMKSVFDSMIPGVKMEQEKKVHSILLQEKYFSGLVERHLHKDGTEVVIEISGIPLFDETSRLKGFRGVVRNITDRMRAEKDKEIQRKQLIQADKMISLGTLVAGVAHEINNPNNFIMMNAPVLKEAWEDILPVIEDVHRNKEEIFIAGLPFSRMRDYIPKLLNGIDDGSRRIKNIVENLRDYARQGVTDMTQYIDVNDIVTASTTLLHNLIKKSTHHLYVEMTEDIPSFPGNFQRLEQVLVNIILNACQSLPDPGKKVRISTFFDKDDDTVVVKVTDEGQGISEMDLKHIFDPFFTTKRESGGMGLGLSISLSIMEEHNGRLVFSSAVGKGTTVSMVFPRISARNQ